MVRLPRLPRSNAARSCHQMTTAGGFDCSLAQIQVIPSALGDQCRAPVAPGAGACETILEGHTDNVTTVIALENGKIVSASVDCEGPREQWAPCPHPMSIYSCNNFLSAHFHDALQTPLCFEVRARRDHCSPASTLCRRLPENLGSRLQGVPVRAPGPQGARFAISIRRETDSAEYTGGNAETSVPELPFARLNVAFQRRVHGRALVHVFTLFSVPHFALPGQRDVLLPASEG